MFHKLATLCQSIYAHRPIRLVIATFFSIGKVLSSAGGTLFGIKETLVTYGIDSPPTIALAGGLTALNAALTTANRAPPIYSRLLKGLPTQSIEPPLAEQYQRLDGAPVVSGDQPPNAAPAKLALSANISIRTLLPVSRGLYYLITCLCYLSFPFSALNAYLSAITLIDEIYPDANNHARLSFAYFVTASSMMSYCTYNLARMRRHVLQFCDGLDSRFRAHAVNSCSRTIMLNAKADFPKTIKRGTLYIQDRQNLRDEVKVSWLVETHLKEKIIPKTAFPHNFFERLAAAGGNSKESTLCDQITKLSGYSPLHLGTKTLIATLFSTIFGIIAGVGTAYLGTSKSLDLFPPTQNFTAGEKESLVIGSVIASLFSSTFIFAFSCYERIQAYLEPHPLAIDHFLTPLYAKSLTLIDSTSNSMSGFIGIINLLDRLLNHRLNRLALILIGIMPLTNNIFMNYSLGLNGTTPTLKWLHRHCCSSEGGRPLLESHEPEVDSRRVSIDVHEQPAPLVASEEPSPIAANAIPPSPPTLSEPPEQPWRAFSPQAQQSAFFWNSSEQKTERKAYEPSSHAVLLATDEAKPVSASP